jgi:hypothetical protein
VLTCWIEPSRRDKGGNVKIISLVAIVGLTPLLGAPAHAEGTRDSVYSAFTRCNQIRDDRQWLDCVYGAAQPMRGELGLPPAPDSQVRLVPAEPDVRSSKQSNIPPPASVPSANHRTGFLSYLLGGNSIIENSKLKSYDFDRSGHFIVVLSNGEIWQQAADDQVLASWRGSPAQYTVSIQTGALGSYTLMVEDEDRAYKVRRAR